MMTELAVLVLEELREVAELMPRVLLLAVAAVVVTELARLTRK